MSYPVGSANRSTTIKVTENGNTLKVTTTNVNYKESLNSLKKMLEISIRSSPDDPNYIVNSVFIKADGVYEELTEENIEAIRSCLYRNKDIRQQKVFIKVNVNTVECNLNPRSVVKPTLIERNQDTTANGETNVIKNLYYNSSPLRSGSKARSISRGKSPFPSNRSNSAASFEDVSSSSSTVDKPRIRNVSPLVRRQASSTTPSINKDKVDIPKSTAKKNSTTAAGIHTDSSSNNELMKMFDSCASISSQDNQSISSTATTLEFKSPITHRTSIAEVNEKLQQSAKKLISRTWHDVGPEVDDDTINTCNEDFLSKIESYSPIRNPTGVENLIAAVAEKVNISESNEDSSNNVQDSDLPQDEVDDSNLSDSANAIELETVNVIETLKSPETNRKNKKILSKTFSASKTLASSGPVYPDGRTGGESLVHYDHNLRKDSTPSTVKKTPSKSKMKLTSPQSKSKRNPDGRPSIGTIENQWEFMKTTYFNNNDEELEWTMVSKGKGAYHHAHRKYDCAEDKYFKCLFEIDLYSRKVTLLTEGSCAKVIKTIENIKDLHASYYVINKRVESPQLKEAESKILSLQSQLRDLVSFDQSIISENFSEKNAEAIFKLASNSKKETITANARNLYADLPVQVQIIRNRLVTANKDSEEALINMEKWSKRERETNDYAKVMREEENNWLSEQLQKNIESLNSMRSLIPVNIASLSVTELMDAAKAEGGHYSLELATELKQNKLLQWVITHPDDIATANFLTGEKKGFFENIESLDVVEMRAIAAIMPLKFELDHDGKKLEWRTRFMSRVKQLSNQEIGLEVKGAWDPTTNSRALVKLPALKQDQTRRSVYYYRTKLQSDQKLKVYNTKHASFEKKLKELEVAETHAKDAKDEYDILLKEIRDKEFVEIYAEKQELIQKAKEIAKQQKDETERIFKKLSLEVEKSKEAIRCLPISRDQFIANELELKDYIEATHQIDWDDYKQPILVDAPFNPDPVINKIENKAAKFMSAEEEAEFRKQEMNSLMNVNKEVSSDIEDSANNTTTNTVNKGLEGRRLTTALLANFSSNNSDIAPLLFTPNKRKNSVLTSYGNTEMLSTLNRMLTNASPASVSSKHNNRASILGSTMKTVSSTLSTLPENEEERKKSVIKQTKSKYLRKFLDPKSALSPKRSSLSPKPTTKVINPMMKLSFLDQLKARANKGNKDEISSPNAKSIPNINEDKENNTNSLNNMPIPPPQAILNQKDLSQPSSKMPSNMMSIFDAIKSRRVMD